MNPSTIGQIYKFKSVLPTLLQILSQKPDPKAEDPAIGAQTTPTYSIQTMMNAVLLLQYLVSFGKTFSIVVVSFYPTLFNFIAHFQCLDGFAEKKIVNETLRRLFDPNVPASNGVEFQFQVVITQVISASDK